MPSNNNNNNNLIQSSYNSNNADMYLVSDQQNNILINNVNNNNAEYHGYPEQQTNNINNPNINIIINNIDDINTTDSNLIKSDVAVDSSSITNININNNNNNNSSSAANNSLINIQQNISTTNLSNKKGIYSSRNKQNRNMNAKVVSAFCLLFY